MWHWLPTGAGVRHVILEEQGVGKSPDAQAVPASGHAGLRLALTNSSVLLRRASSHHYSHRSHMRPSIRRLPLAIPVLCLSGCLAHRRLPTPTPPPDMNAPILVL